jgi:Common central domain of tyrosinase
MSEDFKLRKNISLVSDKERDEFIDALVALNTHRDLRYCGDRNDKPFVGGVSYWFKQDEIHQATHVHGGPAFLTWHRELCNRFERLLSLASEKIGNNKMSLHYWDWNEDPTDLFTSGFMGNSNGEAGEPWLRANFYNPYPKNENYRGLHAFDTDHINPADPPISLTRAKKEGTLMEYMTKVQHVPFYSDQDIVESKNFGQMRLKLEHVHNYAHDYIGGTIGDPHTSFRDPFVFLIHSNVDRLFAAWQLRNDKEFEYRLDPTKVYGCEIDTVATGSTSPRITVGIRTLLSPWCGKGYPYDPTKKHVAGEMEEPGVNDVRPWTYPENWHRDPARPRERAKNSLDPSIVIPRIYDRFPEGFEYNYNPGEKA